MEIDAGDVDFVALLVSRGFCWLCRLWLALQVFAGFGAAFVVLVSVVFVGVAAFVGSAGFGWL